MRLQHLKQTADGLSADDPARAAAKAVIVEEVERLHWRLWNGKAKDAQISIDRIRTVMHHFQGEQGERKSIAPSRKLWTALHALDGYLTGQSDWMVNYAERHRAGLRVGTAITEGTANFLVNRRMNKSPANALVATRSRPPAPGSLRGLQWHAWFRLRTEVSPSQRYTPDSGDCRLTPETCDGPLRSAAPASGGFGPDRIGRTPSLAMAESSAKTSSTKWSTLANASHEPGDVLAAWTAVPICLPRCY